jgi:methionyl-tRNA synthetase
MAFKRHTITAALPYANGPIHVGHLAGVYVPADIYARYLREKGENVLFVCGSDEHGVPITIRARNEGMTPQQVVDKYHEMIKDSFERFGVTFDIYSRTSSEIHHKTASEIFQKLYEKNLLEEKTSEQYYDVANEQFLADRYIIGTCPKCGFEEAYGDQCESCGSTLSPSELINPRSALSGEKPVLKETKHWYLPLEKYDQWLKEWILEGHTEWKTNVYGQCKSWIDGGLQPRAVTRDLEWGVPVPLPETEGKVLYVWFDAPIGYISATKHWAQLNNKNWEPYWKSNDTKLVHFIGKDNIVFHCIIFPVMLHAHGSFILPENVPANEFLNLEGKKISTSRNWAVWLHEYLDDFKGKEDVLRYALCANMPETKDNDFTWKDFQAKNNNELVAILGNFVNRALVLTHKFYEGKVPKQDKLFEIDKEVVKKVQSLPKQIASSLDNFKFREALGGMLELARIGNKYLADTEPWKVINIDKDRVGTILNIGLQIVANLSILSAPFLPFTNPKLVSMLNIKKFNWDQAGKMDLLTEGHELSQPSLLFEKIEDAAIEAQIFKLHGTKTANNNGNTTEVKKEITFDDFLKLDLRTGTILEAKKVLNSKKLLQLLVDTGIDKRTVVSGIAEHYDPDDIVGKQVCMVLNLAPRKIMGIESKGMVLMATDHNGKLYFLQPDDVIGNGSVIS